MTGEPIPPEPAEPGVEPAPEPEVEIDYIAEARVRAQPVLARLDQIIDFQGTPTAAQVFAAVQDLAKFQRSIIRFVITGEDRVSGVEGE